ncbi:MAG: response regulator transcription factor [Campylobacterota bacterium]|nr:response regulator transcription factor [Campylobacterota bacterium]
MEVVLYSDDINLIQKWENAIEQSCQICYDFKELENIRNSIIILNYTSFEGDVKSSLQRFNDRGNRVLIFHNNPNLKTAKELLKVGAKGYGNVIIKDYFIVSAIETIKDGMVWLHSEFTTMLIDDATTKKNNTTSLNLDVLSKREKEVVYLLKDGISYKEIAEQLSITPRTIKAHAHSIYNKLNVKDRLSLVLLFN